MIFGGFAPLAAVSLSALAGGHYWPPAAMLVVISAIGIWCTLRLRRLAAPHPSAPLADSAAVPAPARTTA
ncbi:hypothetical protein ACQ86F_00930 [Streptomyces venezuelae ATCC 10712]